MLLPGVTERRGGNYTACNKNNFVSNAFPLLGHLESKQQQQGGCGNEKGRRVLKEPNDKRMGPRTHLGSQTSTEECPWAYGCHSVLNHSTLEGGTAQAGCRRIDRAPGS